MKAALLVAVLAQAAAPVRPPARDASSLESRLALSVAERLLASNNSDERVRGIDGLATSGQREAIDRLVRALEPSSSAWRDSRARIAALRALAPYAAREPVRQALTKALSSEPGRSPLAQFAQETAAMALAASEDPRALDVLVSAVRQGGSPSGAAVQALLAYPPKSIVAFGAVHDGLAAPLSQLLARLHDVRGIGLLRATLARGFAVAGAGESGGDAPAEDQIKKARVAAALALSELGDEEQVPVARGWLAGTDPDLRLAGAEVLVRSHAKEAESAVVAVMRAPELRAPAIRLAASMPRLALLAPLAEAAGGSGPTARVALAALGRMDAREAIEKLSALARDPAHALDAAFALARAPGGDARRALEALLAESGQKRLAARAGVVRALVLGDEPSGLSNALAALLASPDPADRAAAAFGRVALRQDDGAKLLRSSDAAVVRAVARASVVWPRELGRPCLARLAAEKDEITRAALGVALAVAPDAWELLSTDQLSAWADSESPLAPLSALALGERERDGVPSAARRLLASADPILRAHAAFGLGRSPLADATGRLADALRFEPDESVRRAIVTALSARRETQKWPALNEALRFDPDARVRELARLALRGEALRPLVQSGAACRREGAGACHVAWIALVPSRPAARRLVENRPAQWLDSSGLSLPVVADPDGAALVAGVSPGAATFRLASGPFWYDARAHDAVEAEPAR
jgi:hypothetical protein